MTKYVNVISDFIKVVRYHKHHLKKKIMIKLLNAEKIQRKICFINTKS